MNTDARSAARMTTHSMLQQYKSHTCNHAGYHGIRIGNNQMDVFPPVSGFATPTRFRNVRGEWVYQHGPKTGVPADVLKALSNGRVAA